MQSEGSRVAAQLLASVAAGAVVLGLWWGMARSVPEVALEPGDGSAVAIDGPSTTSRRASSSSVPPAQVRDTGVDGPRDGSRSVAEDRLNLRANAGPVEPEGGAAETETVEEMLDDVNDIALSHLYGLQDRIAFLDDAESLSPEEEEELQTVRALLDEFEVLMEQSEAVQDDILDGLQGR